MKQNYENFYNENAFWSKIKNFGKNSGKTLLEKVLILYFVLLDKKTPLADKSIILGALGYFILPVDAIPDFLALAGYTDDLGVIIAASKKISKNIKEEHKSSAKEKASILFKWKLKF